MKNYIKILFISCLILVVTGCGASGHPVPPEAFAICTDSGGKAIYFSSIARTTFKCDL